MNYFQPPTTIGKTGKSNMPDGRIIKYKVVDEIQHEQRTSSGQKIFYLQKLQFEDNNHIELRFCYYIIGIKPGLKGRWVYGQFAPIIPHEDFKAIIDKARERNWL